MPYHQNTKLKVGDGEAHDLLWGARAIASYLGRTERQIYYMHASGRLRGAVKKIGHRSLVGSKRRLEEVLFENPPAD
jgi:hypothetical protein